MSTLELLVDGAVLACVATPPAVAVNTVTVTPGSANNVLSSTLKSLIASDIENASGATDDTVYTITGAVTPGSGHFESFVISSGATTKFYDGSEQLHLVSAGGTCTFVVDTPAKIPNPAAPPPTIDDPVSSYPATWTVQSSGQSPVYLKAAP